MARPAKLPAEVAYWRWWLRREGKALLLGLGLVASLLALAVYALAQLRQPREESAATIVAFGNAATKLGDRPTVTVRTSEGRTLQLHAAPSSLAGCRRGDSVHLVRRGSFIGIGRRGCRPAATPEGRGRLSSS